MTRFFHFVLIVFLVCLSANGNAQVRHYLQGENIRLIELDKYDRLVAVTNRKVCFQSADFSCADQAMAGIKAFDILDSGDLMIASSEGLFSKAYEDFIPIIPPMQGFNKAFDVIPFQVGYLVATDKGIWNYQKIPQKYPTKKAYQFSEHQQFLDWNGNIFSVVSNALVGVTDSSRVHVLPNRITSVGCINDEAVVGVEDQGLYIFNQQDFVRLNFPNIDLGLQIKFIVQYEDYLLISSENGLFKWRASTNDIFEIPFPSDVYRYVVNDACLDRWGNLSLATNNGIYQFNIDPNQEEEVPFFLVESIEAFDRSNNSLAIKKQEIQLKEKERFLKVYFEAFHSSGNLIHQYSFRDQVWVDIKPNDALVLTDIPSGRSLLKLRASKNGKRFSTPYELQIVKPRSENWMAFLPFALLALGLILLWWWSLNRQKNLQKAILNERDKLKLENEKLKFEHKSMQLQMNPHFLFNALNSIQGLIALNENKKARNHLGQFSQMMRAVLNQSREDEIDVLSETKFLNQYLELEKLCRNNTFDFEVTSTLDESLKIPPMIVQPFVENAIIHGMAGLDRRGNIKVTFEDKDAHVLCIVDDNGVGRGREENRKSNHKSVALNLVNERLSKLFKRKDQFVHFEDKADEQGTPSGTKVLIQLPIIN